MLGAGNADAYGDDGDSHIEYMYGGGYDDLGQLPKWFEHGNVTESRINNIQSINCVAFDPFEEVVWTGLQTGRTVSYLMPTMEKYTAFSSCVGETRQIMVDQEGVIALNEQELRCYTRGGLFQLSIPSHTAPSLRNMMNCMTWLNMGSGTILVGGDAGLAMLDVSAGGRLLKDIPLPGSVTTLRRSRAVWCGYNHGAVAYLDPRTMRTEYTIDVHSGSLIDCDAKGDLLVTCGCSARSGQLFVDPVVKVYDVRTRVIITNVNVPTGNPSILRFHPNFSSTLVIVSQTGGFQLCDVAGDNPGSDMYFQIDIGDDVLTSFDICSTGEAMAFGDSGGYVHVWSDRTDLRVNMYSSAPEMPDPLPSHTGRIFDDSSSLGHLGLNNMGLRVHGSDGLLSDWPPSLLYNVGLPPKPIDPALLAQTRVLDFVGYIANPGYIRYQIRNQHIGTGYLKAQPGKPGWVHSLAPVSVRPPKQYRWVEIKYSKLGFDDFNFARYNRTVFAGLENSLPNSYCNSCVQVLYFIPHLRVNMLNHLCNKEFCLSCELGFLFYMLNKGRGTTVPNVQASNFLRAFRQIPQAAALGLFQAPELSDTPLSQLIEGFNRFVLEQFNKELATPPYASLPPLAPTTPVDSLFGSTTTTTTRCQTCGHVHERTARTFQFELVYPVPANTTIAVPPAPLGTPPKPILHSSPFTAAVTASLCRETSTKAWCEKCCHYHPSTQRKTTHALPHILCLASGSARTNPDLWRAPIPQKLTVRLSPLSDPSSSHSHAVSVGEYSETDTLSENDDLYELTAVISHISDPSKKSPKSGHIVAQIRIPSAELPGGEKQNWFLFNDFRISPSNLEDVVNFDISWKTCCVLYYKHVDMEKRIPMPFYTNPITFDVFFARNPFKGGNSISSPKEVEKLNRNEEPQEGDLVAIDAEFVSLGAEETELRSDGTKVIINPAHFGLARVSVVKGDPRKAGIPFIDDYIVTPEPITDYLTRFSGIEIGDLDPAVSTKPLTTLKAVYLKLRYLVDRGVLFVGHGLAKDFRIINIVVPPDQVIDTVELFHIPRQRKIALKFLASFLLNIDIQTGTHNSIEDARTALALYRSYLGLTEAGQFEPTLNQIYHIGRLTNWSPESVHIALKNEKG